MLVHTYPPLIEGVLVRRYQRFFADIRLSCGEIVVAHCPNTGPMTGVCAPDSKVWLSKSNNPKRKLSYTWEIIEVDGELVGINTALPNYVIGKMIADHLLGELEPYANHRSEVPYGQEKSRIDFLLSGNHTDRYVEVKNTTWCKGSLALFPDTITTRGQKHIRELTNVIDNDSKATIVYFINRGDCHQFSPGDTADPEYGQLLRSAATKGLDILACRFRVSPVGVDYLGLAEVIL